MTKHYAMKKYCGVDVKIYVFFTSALVGGECSVSRSRCLNTEERVLGTHWIRGWMCPRAALDDTEK
jgi:hypothetical protein